MNILNLIGVSLLSCNLVSFSLFKTNESKFCEMDNGDFSLNGNGSITDELSKYKIDKFDYLTGVKGDTPLTIAEADDSLYIYLFNNNGYLDFDTVSFGYYNGDLKDFNYNNLEYTEKSLTLVSFDETHKFGKFLINDVAPNKTSDHVYLIREVYNFANKQSTNFIQGIGMVYQYDHETDLVKVTTEETIRITNKLVSYELYPSNSIVNGKERVHQRNYVAFSTERKIEDLIQVKLKYDGFYYSGYTNIPLNFSGSKWDGTEAFKNYAQALSGYDINKQMDKSYPYIETDKFENKVVDVNKNKINVNVNYDNFWFWQKDYNGSFTYDCIEKTTDLDTTKIINQDILNYDYIVTFDSHEVDVLSFFNEHGFFNNKLSSVGNLFVGISANNVVSINSAKQIIASMNESDKNELKNYYGLDSSATDEDIINKAIELNEFDADYTLLYNREFNSSDVNKLLSDKTLYFSKNKLLEVENLSLLEFTYMVDNLPVRAIVVDSYNDVKGGNQIGDNTVNGQSPIEEFFQDAVEWLSDLSNPLVQFVNIILILIVILVVIKIITMFVNLFKKDRINKIKGKRYKE